MSKRFTIPLFCSVFVAFFATSVPLQAQSSWTWQGGQSGEVALAIESDARIGAVDLSLRFDADRLRIAKVETGLASANGMLSVGESQPGELRVALIDGDGIQAPGPVFEFALVALDAKEPPPAIQVESLTANDADTLLPVAVTPPPTVFTLNTSPETVGTRNDSLTLLIKIVLVACCLVLLAALFVWIQRRRTAPSSVGCLLLTSIALVPVSQSLLVSRAHAQQVVSYQLERVKVGIVRGQSHKDPSEIYADSSGGKVVVDMFISEGCTEAVEFSWTFGSDITFLRLGESFEVNAVVSTTECRGNQSGPEIALSGLGSGGFRPEIRDTLSVSDQRLFSMETGMIADGDNPRQVYGKRTTPNARPIGRGSFGFTTHQRPPYEGSWFTVNVSAESRKGDGRLNDKFLELQVAYLFRGTEASQPPETISVESDNPLPGNDSTEIIGPGGDGMDDQDDDQSGETSGDPCLDPDVQRCIDLWVAMAIRLRNERQPEQGPWSTSPYGHWVNRITTGHSAPDGWVEKYHGSRYCYLWDVAASEHEESVYDGDLPSLHEYVYRCVESDMIPPPDPGEPPDPDERPDDDDQSEDDGSLDPDEDLGPDDEPANPLPPAGGRLGDLNLTIRYPIDLVELVGSTPGRLPASTLFDLNDQPPGSIRIGLADARGVTGGHSLCRLDFQVGGQPGDLALLDATVTSAHRTDNHAVTFRVIDGQIVIGSETIPGDFNGDGTITSLDALAALRMSIGKLEEDLVLDVDSDGRVTAKDARLILGMATGSGTPPPGTGPSTRPGITSPNDIDMSGPTILVTSATKQPGETASIVVALNYE